MSTQRTWAGKVRFAILYTLYFVAALSLFSFFFFYRPFLSDLRTTRAPEQDVLDTEFLPAETMAKVGWWRNSKKSAFYQFTPKKTPGSTRLCAFGDSFTQGDETRWDMDYPSFLNRHGERLGLPIETLNFGSSWWGFHQTYILWEDFAEKYSCDATLLGPMTFYSSRDSAFNHTDYSSPYHLHSLFVLEEGELRRLDVLGDTPSERFRKYFSFLPAWRYLRYDRQAPAAVAALLPRGRRIDNPFYYARPWEDSALDIYRALLRRMLEEAPEMRVVAAQYPVLPDWFSDLQHPRLDAFVPEWPKTFPYLAPHGHNSAWGNDFLSRLLFQSLFPEAELTLPILSTQDAQAQETVQIPEPIPRRRLDAWKSLRIETQNRSVGHFARIDPGSEQTGPESLHQSGVVALLGLQPAHLSLLDAYWLEIDRELRPGAEIRLRVGADEIDLGPLQEPVPGMNLGTVKLPGLEFERELLLREHPRITSETLDPAETFVLVDGIPYEITPPRMLRATRGGYRAPEELPEQGFFELVAEAEDGNVYRRTIAEWKLRDLNLRSEEHPSETAEFQDSSQRIQSNEK